jgi:TolB-like protein/DNA-binding SARP family transcriptional activator
VSPSGPRAELRLLGAFGLSVDGAGRIDVPSKKNRALLAIIALSPGQRATREKLCGLLWGDRGEEQARSSLRQSLAVLRRDLGGWENLILSTRDDLVALQTETLIVDAIELQSLSGSTDKILLQRAAELCRGELLVDTAIREAGFEDWLAGERRRLKDLAISALERLAESETATAAISVARQLLSLDPLRESSHRMLMTALSKAGERALALQQYAECAQLMRTEFGVEPAAETDNLKALITKGGAAPAQTPAVSGSPTEPLRPVPSEASIAVLPFAVLGDDREQQYFADGLTEDLITALARQPGFFVIHRDSSFAFREASTGLDEVAAKLGVRNILQGNIRSSGGRLRVNVHLVDTLSHSHKWSDRFDREMADVFATQDEIVQRIVEALTGKMASPASLERYRPVSMEAYDLCMRGRGEWRRSDTDGVQARPLFERAIALDPNYSEAYRWLAQCQCLGWLHYGWPLHPSREESVTNSARAVELDPSDPAAHALHAMVLMYERRWDDAEAGFATALRLNPNDSDTWMNLSDLRVMQGRGADAVACSERSLLNSPQPVGAYWLMGQAQFAAGQYEDAVATLMRDDVRRSGARRLLAAALARLGRIDEARLEAQMFMSAFPYFRIGHWVASQPFKDQAAMQEFVEAYRRAGLPE